ncbi:hypothetical protein [Modestobacter roseus]|uniref:Cobyrinic acid a,c-diamide synthase n=1 Tax=Modestobacter roseus TaxID=1181884 RepID=A0A562IP52_9ACTN|nr:hypothetical protein [Modestobacter roseus]MQA35087.1 hypothetical protein [Modestobacter roseus]TWH72660.1 hypothetical protein JD78_01180 [Modestobacter roseus]
MTRRPVLPGASELFRRTDTPAAPSAPVTELSTLAAAQASPALRGTRAEPAAEPQATPPQPGAAPLTLVPDVAGGAPRIVVDELAGHRATLPAAPAAPAQAAPRQRADRGRTRHEEKITVYCSAEELLALESARLTLRGQHGVVADRGRIVREAIAVLLSDYELHAEDSVLVRRLRK